MILNTLTGDNDGMPARPSTQLLTVFGNTDVPSNAVMTELTALSVPAFWRAVNYKARTEAALPRCVYRRIDDDESEKLPDHPVSKLLNERINATTRPFNFFSAYNHHRIVWGNGYGILQKDGNDITGILNCNPEIIQPFVFGGKKWYFLELQDGSVLEGVELIELDERRGYVLADTDVIHSLGPSYSGIRGYPVVQMLRQALEVGKSAETHSSRFFKNGTFVRGAIEIPGTLTDAQLQSFRDSLNGFRGAVGSNAFELMLLQAGAKLNNSTIANETSQLIETRKLSNLDVCRIIGVPPHVLYELDKATWSNIEQLGIEIQSELALDTLEQDQEFTEKLLTEAERADGYYVKTDLSGLARADRASQVTEVTNLVNNGLMLPNLGAAKLGLPNLGPDGDKLRIPVAYSQPLEDSTGAAPEAPESTTSPEPESKGSDAPAVAPEAPVAPLNGAQIEAAINVVVQLRAGVLSPASALALLSAVGISAAVAKAMVEAEVSAGALTTVTPGTPAPATEVEPAPDTANAQSQDEAKAPEPADYSAALEPLLFDACERIEAKTVKAFERRQGKPADEVSAWAKQFAAEQNAYLFTSFKPLSQTAQHLGMVIDVDAIANAYESELIAYAQTNEKRNLLEIAKEIIYGQ